MYALNDKNFTLKAILDYIAPIKSVTLKDQEDQTPWIDLELAQTRNKRDMFYKTWTNILQMDPEVTKQETRKIHEDYQECKAKYQTLYRKQMKIKRRSTSRKRRHISILPNHIFQ